MRLAMISEHASPLAVLGGVDSGGQNVHVAALASAIARQGVETVVHTRRDDMDLPRHIPFAPGVTVDHVSAGPPRPMPKDDIYPHIGEFAEDLTRQWTASRPDVVHAHFWMSGLAALEAARPLGIPVVMTFHALGVVKRRHQGSKDSSPADRLHLEERLVRTVDRVVATCSDEVFELMRLGATRSSIRVAPCGVDLSMFSPEGPTEPRANDRYRLVFVGRLVERKGIGNIISALADVPNAELVVAGGPDRSELEDDREIHRLRSLAEDDGVADRVVFRGRVSRNDLPALLRSADAVLCVPWYEPFGIVPLEAMACGIPVVASAVGGLIDSVVDGTTGLHVPPRSPERIAEALNELLPDEDRRRTFGAAGARRARSRYSWDRVASLTLQAYDSVLPGAVTQGEREFASSGARGNR
ncbi:MAG TPA: glycosyltransferase [Frankiaceae bacterium]|nr:glycosyltransferase [Frankiaceae bacterium]